MSNSIVIKIVAGLALAMGATSSSAVTINVDFNTTGGPSGTYSGQGAASDVGNNFWNGINTGAQFIAAGPITSGALTASNGITPTLVTVSLGTYGSYDTANGGVSQNVLAPALLNDLVYQPGTSSFAFNNVPAGLYDLYVYSLTGGHSAGASPLTYDTSFTIGATTNHVIQPNVIPATFVLGQNYTVFNGISPNGSGLISGTWTFVSGTGDNAVLNGFQLVSIPEPSSIALLIMSLAGLITVGRR